ncbi:MAG TPA: endo-1,4-beta-xylanase [Actinophytocola sp.]|uniref:endo-1,4-beta-xylanase n=1 Tax=Actinophytocola sp. TaxID=1872138 RepID=UPI002E012B3C|nr:endo-1,4-beta-xylanase [Actinophytocola sp.]
MRKATLTVLCGVIVGAVVPAPAQAAAPGSLGALAAARGRYFGDAVDHNELPDPVYRPIINTEFTSLTPGNAMKWDVTEPIRGQFTFTRGDEIVAVARANGQAVRGHTLVWHSQSPAYLQGLTNADLRTTMRNHISALVTHYQGQLSAWDVVNEPLAADGSLRPSFWLQKLGPGYVAEAFRAARAADPNVKLYRGELGAEGIGAKSDGLYLLVQSLLQQGVPIDGVGFQAHVAIQLPFPSGMRQNLQRFADLGLDVAVTELEVRMPLPPDSAKFATQATVYRDVVNACLVVTRCVGVTVRNYTDKYSFVPVTFPNEGSSSLADQNFVRKPAYAAVRDALAAGPVDTIPPTVPGTPTVTDVTAGGASLSWTPSTDTGGSGLAGYNVYRRQGGTDTLLLQTILNSVRLAGLAPGTVHVIVVRARDGAGNLSQPTPPVVFTTLPGWGAALGQTTGSPDVTATSQDFNRALAPSGSTNIGFNGTVPGSNPAPATFTPQRQHLLGQLKPGQRE